MDIKYNARWIHLETLLIFQTEKFVYLPEVVIIDLSSIFSTSQVDYINEPYVKLLMNTSMNKSIILMTNIITTNINILEIIIKHAIFKKNDSILILIYSNIKISSFLIISSPFHF